MCIRGRSAGGYTTLAALCDQVGSQTFAAGTSLFGIADLAMVSPMPPLQLQLFSVTIGLCLQNAEDGHKFESHYTFKLLGGTPQQVPEVYKTRSPLFNAHRIQTPLLILQGTADRVVTPRQADLIADAVRESKGRIELKFYEGEGHGWRQVETIKDALERERSFYERVLKVTISLPGVK